MALIIVMSTGNILKYVGMYYNCRSVNEKVENDLLGQVIFIITILSVMTVFSTLERYPFETPN